jgi:hypothetical protein
MSDRDVYSYCAIASRTIFGSHVHLAAERGVEHAGGATSSNLRSQADPPKILIDLSVIP